MINLLLVGAAVYIFYRRQHPAPEPPSPGPIVASTPEPAIPTASPTAAPEPSAAPIPTAPPAPPPAATPEPPLNLATLAPKFIPRQVVLLKPEDFVMMSQRQAVGSVHAPAGVQVALVEVASDGQVEVQMGELRKTIPAADTDIESRARALMKYR